MKKARCTHRREMTKKPHWINFITFFISQAKISVTFTLATYKPKEHLLTNILQYPLYSQHFRQPFS